MSGMERKVIWQTSGRDEVLVSQKPYGDSRAIFFFFFFSDYSKLKNIYFFFFFPHIISEFHIQNCIVE